MKTKLSLQLIKVFLTIFPFFYYRFNNDKAQDEIFINKLTLFMGLIGVLGFLQHTVTNPNKTLYSNKFAIAHLAFGISLLTSYGLKKSFNDKIQILFTYSLMIIFVGLCHINAREYVKGIVNIILGILILYKTFNYFITQ